MLTACGSSPNDGGVRSAPAPVIEQRTEVKLVCPPELTAPPADRPEVSADAALQGNAAGMSWLGAMLAWANGLSDRLDDARKACP
ncbi:MAG: hypothetical protein AB7E24_00355 [Novosphingobium sp.]